MLSVLKENMDVAVDSKDSKVFIVSGTFSQIEAVHKRLQLLINQTLKGEKEFINYAKTTAQPQQLYSSFEVQPQLMKLLKRVYKMKLQEIEETFCVQIVWDENATQVCISPGKMSNRQNRHFQEGCDAFIDLYQKFHPNMGREEVELPNSTDEARIIEAVSLAEAEDPVIIERIDRNLVVYAEKNRIRSSVQSLKEKLGLTNDGSSRKTKRGQGIKRRDARGENETSYQRLSIVLGNKVKLSLYQGDITDELVDAIVNAANERLQHGAGVAGAIVRKGGRNIQAESNQLIKRYGPLDVGGAAFTSGGNLSCRYVIHTVGPEWNKHGKDRSETLLRRACIESLRLAAGQLQLSSIALTAISSGIFGMPKDICARIMFSAVEEFSSSEEAEFSTLRDVRIVIIDEPTMSVFQKEFVKRYLSQEASPETVTTQGRPSDDHIATPPIPNTKPEVGKSIRNDSFASVDQQQSGENESLDEQPEQNRDVYSPNIAADPDDVNGGQLADPESIKKVSPSDQDPEKLKKGSMSNGVNRPKVEAKASHDLKHDDSVPVVNSVKGNKITDSKAFYGGIGRGRSNIAAKFQTSSQIERLAALNVNSHLQEQIANTGRGRGITLKNATTTTSPPGLAVTEEGKILAKSIGDRVTGDPKSTVDDDVEKNESSSEGLKEIKKHNNDGENPEEDFLIRSPTDQGITDQSHFNHRDPSGNNFTPDEMPDQDKTTRGSERPSSDGCGKRPPVEHTENDKLSHDQHKKGHTKSGKKVKHEPESVAHATNDETVSLQDPLPLSTAEGEVQAAIKSLAHDNSTTSCPHSSSDHRVSRQSFSEVDKVTMEEKEDTEGCTKQDPEEGT